MNKTTLFIVFAMLAALGLIGLIVVLIFADQHATFYASTLTTILVLVAGSATTFYMLGKNQSTLELVKTQTNGANTALREENAALNRQLLSLVGSSPAAPLTGRHHAEE